MRIAMWSGPRNLSTAMMYSFGARSDCAVADEPFYAAYLAATGLDHPMREEIIAQGETDPARIAAMCAAEAPDAPIFYQKHMAHHMLPGFDRSWMQGAVNVFLIRHPARVIASYAAKRESPTLEDIGFPQQLELFEEVAKADGTPVVVDSHDIRAQPRETLENLCAAIGVPFQPSMLSWPAGGNAADGVWGAHWYGAVRRSTGFADPEGPLPEVPETLREVLDAALPIYAALRAHSI